MQEVARAHDATTQLHDAARTIQLLLTKIQADDGSSADGKRRVVAVASILRGRLGELAAIKQVRHLRTRFVTSLQHFCGCIALAARGYRAGVVGARATMCDTSSKPFGVSR